MCTVCLLRFRFIFRYNYITLARIDGLPYETVRASPFERLKTKRNATRRASRHEVTLAHEPTR
jgi:hypothetical protein